MIFEGRCDAIRSKGGERMSRASERRKAKDSDAGSGAYWMDTYGDMVTLILTFFVLLFSFSTIDAEKWKSIVGAFAGTASIAVTALDPEMVMENPIEVIMTTEADDYRYNREDSGDDQSKREYEQFLKLYKSIDNYIAEHELKAKITVDYDAYTVTVRFSDNIFFDSGKADIRPESEAVLNHMTSVFAENMELIEMIRIEGHTDNVPISTPQYPSNWELSVSRAVNTLRYILDTGLIEKEKISAVGYSEYHPVDTNDTAEGRASNRRVDFVVQGYKSK